VTGQNLDPSPYRCKKDARTTGGLVPVPQILLPGVVDWCSSAAFPVPRVLFLVCVYIKGQTISRLTN
jgi:hypothetical protein